MTTHIEKIQALGNRIVDNLNTMGVSASFSDGALTLADKILEIQTGGVIVFPVHNMVKSNDSVKLYALLTHGTDISNKIIEFYKVDNETEIKIGESTTNENGIATLEYQINNSENILVKYNNMQSKQVTVHTLDLSIETHGTYDTNLKNINISGNVLIDNQAVEKPIQIYRYNNNWEYLNTVTSNTQGEFSLIDKGAVYLNDDTVAGTRNELQALINNAIANNESEVVLEKKYVFSENDAPVLITSSIQINGNNHIIDANNYSQIFTVTGNDVTISDLILINGYANGNGGAVNWSGENGVLSNILFANCECTNNGGAVYWTGNHGTVQNCRAVNNRTGSNGTIYAEVDNFTITNHESFGNHSEGEGGCMDIRGNYAHIESINTSKDRSGGGKACINVIGDNSNIHHIDMDSPVFGGSYINRSYISEDSFKYKVQPAPSWIENYEDFALEKEYTPIHDILISSDKDILSFEDNDVATLTAQLVDSNNESIPFNGLSVTFEVREVSDDNLVETLSGVTDSSGTATVRYSSKSIGDLNIKAECMFLTKTYGIIDGTVTYLGDKDKTSDWVVDSNTVLSYSSEGYYQLTPKSGKVGTYPIIASQIDLPTDFELSAKVLFDGYNSQPKVGASDGTNHHWFHFNKIDSRFNVHSTPNDNGKSNISFWQNNVWYDLTLKVQANTITAIVYDQNGTKLLEESVNRGFNTTVHPYVTFGFNHSSNTYVRFKEMIYKPL